VGALFSNRGQKTFWVAVDQAIASVGNFATTILVGRAAAAAQFGTFGMLMEVYVVFNSLQSALVVYPLTIRGAVLEKEALKRMASACLLFTIVLCIPLSLAMAGTTVLFNQASILVWVCIAMILAQLQETLRRTLLAHLEFRAAIPGDAISYLLQAAVLYALLHEGRLNLRTAFIAMGATSGLAAIVQALQVGLRPIAVRDLRGLVADFWQLGRWILFSNLTSIATNLTYNWTLALAWGTTQVAYFTVIVSPMKVVNPLMTALASVIIPMVSRLRHQAGVHRAKVVGAKYAAIGFAVLVPYVLVILVFAGPCIRILYGNRPEYVGLGMYLRVFAISYSLGFIGNATLACANGLGNTRANFGAMLVNAILSLTVALPLAYLYGIKGIVVGGFIATAAYTCVAVYYLVKSK
jgi:O-antigen/teichoic acid export membrane protein